MMQSLRNDEAVSTVVAAILILAVLTTFISTINAFYIPSLGTDMEVSHIQEVRDSFVEIASKATSGSSSEKIQLPLGSDGLPLSFTPSSSGSLTVDPRSGWINISMENVAIPETRFDGFYPIQNVTSVSTLYLISNGSSTGAPYVVTLDGQNTIEVTRSSQSMNVDSMFNENHFLQQVATPNTDGRYFTFDLLNPVFGFSDALESFPKPFTLTLEEGSFFVEYEKLPPYTYAETAYPHYYDEQINVTTGNLRYRSSNNFWIDQDYIFENGAVILQQSTSNESLVRSKPFITLDKDKQLLIIEIFTLNNSRSDSMSGNGVSTINLQVERGEEKVYPSVDNTTIQIASEYPDAWQKFLSELGTNATINNGTVMASFENKTVKISETDVKVVLP